MDLTGLKVGDYVAIPNRNSHYNKLAITHSLKQIERVTGTQLVCGTYRIRRSDGHVIGETYRYAVIATPELIRENIEQTKTRDRWYAATRRCTPIEDALAKRKLTVEQMEKLADLYESFKTT
ncbi:hypothetical protein [Rhodoferax mekongensis]|uniref:Uncharacterized protein n=1 Tax=Rhodoferax mekongensis TaxID=3068341 RepID=A0ABZ0B271_9BURK|nr:hypothetical protein [Rhodoferax sp. TBRC 17307]WNO06013.1 hypothetical protein RAN89_06175 [Rhodoferax sp. TBRC 17307]